MTKPSRREIREAEEMAIAEERARIAALEHAVGALPRCAASIRLRLVMLERAWWLLDAAEAVAADAILEFLPQWQVTKLLTEFFETQNEFNSDLYLSAHDRRLLGKAVEEPVDLSGDQPTDKRTKLYLIHQDAMRETAH